MSKDDFLSSFLLPVEQVQSLGISIEQYNELVIYTLKAVSRVNELEGSVHQLSSKQESEGQKSRREKIDQTNKLASATNKLNSSEEEVGRYRSLEVLLQQYKKRITNLEQENEAQKSRKTIRSGNSSNIEAVVNTSNSIMDDDDVEDLWSDDGKTENRIVPTIVGATVAPPPLPPPPPKKTTGADHNTNQNAEVKVIHTLPPDVKKTLENSMNMIAKLVKEQRLSKESLKEFELKVLRLEKVIHIQKQSIDALEVTKQQAKVAIRAIRLVSYKQICKQLIQHQILDKPSLKFVENHAVKKRLDNLDTDAESSVEEQEQTISSPKLVKKQSSPVKISPTTNILVDIVNMNSGDIVNSTNNRKIRKILDDDEERDTDMVHNPPSSVDMTNSSQVEHINDDINNNSNNNNTTLPAKKKEKGTMKEKHTTKKQEDIHILDTIHNTTTSTTDIDANDIESVSNTASIPKKRKTYLGQIDLPVPTSKKRILRDREVELLLEDPISTQTVEQKELGDISKKYATQIHSLSTLHTSPAEQTSVQTQLHTIYTHYMEQSDATPLSILHSGVCLTPLSKKFQQIVHGGAGEDTYINQFPQFIQNIQDIANVQTLVVNDTTIEAIQAEYEVLLQTLDLKDTNAFISILISLGMIYFSAAYNSKLPRMIQKLCTHSSNLSIQYYACIVEAFPQVWNTPQITTEIITPSTIFTNLQDVIKTHFKIPSIDVLSVDFICHLALLNNIPHILATIHQIPQTLCTCATGECGLCTQKITNSLLTKYFPNWTQSLYTSERIAGNIRQKLLFYVLYKAFQEQNMSMEMQEVLQSILQNAPWQWACIIVERVLLPLYTSIDSVFYQCTLLYALTSLTSHIMPHIANEGPAGNTIHILRILATTTLLDNQVDQTVRSYASILLSKANYSNITATPHISAAQAQNTNTILNILQIQNK